MATLFHAEQVQFQTDGGTVAVGGEMQITQGEWADPERAKRKPCDYADQRIIDRPGLRLRTVELGK